MVNDDGKTGSSRNFSECSCDSGIPENLEDYREKYRLCLEQRNGFWKNEADFIKWDSPFNTVVNEDFSAFSISWFGDGRLNGTVNAVDVNVEKGKGSETAVVLYGSGGKSVSLTYSELSIKSKTLASALKADGFKAGDRIALCIENSLESVIFMLACARIGVIYVPIPGRFTAEVISEIISDSGATMVVVSIDSKEQPKFIELLDRIEGIKVINTGSSVVKNARAFNDFTKGFSEDISPVSFESEHPLFIIYANSAAGIPRGSVFATGGYLVEASSSFRHLFMYGGKKVPGAILSTKSLSSAAGQCYGLWGPLLNGVCAVLTDESETEASVFIKSVIENFKSPVMLTSPRILSTLKRELDGKNLGLSGKFELVACCGDVLSPRLVYFAGDILTDGAEKVLNLWIQSESGVAIINTLPVSGLNRPGALGLPFYGIEPVVLNNLGEVCRPNESGQLIFLSSWPAMIRTIWGQPERFGELYFRRIPGNFSTNDGVRADNEGFFWFMGRLDDVIKLRGQSLATSEIETSLITHPEISEAAVVNIGGEENDTLYAFLVRQGGDLEKTDILEAELAMLITKRIGEFAVPNKFIFTHELPRTRTGKIVRRILRRVATGDISIDEDLSHVANPESIKKLIQKEGL